MLLEKLPPEKPVEIRIWKAVTDCDPEPDPVTSANCTCSLVFRTGPPGKTCSETSR
jgi:hypothetical protein